MVTLSNEQFKQLYEYIIQNEGGITREELANRLKIKPDKITNMLGGKQKTTKELVGLVLSTFPYAKEFVVYNFIDNDYGALKNEYLIVSRELEILRKEKEGLESENILLKNQVNTLSEFNKFLKKSSLE